MIHLLAEAYADARTFSFCNMQHGKNFSRFPLVIVEESPFLLGKPHSTSRFVSAFIMEDAASRQCKPCCIFCKLLCRRVLTEALESHWSPACDHQLRILTHVMSQQAWRPLFVCRRFGEDAHSFQRFSNGNWRDLLQCLSAVARKFIWEKTSRVCYCAHSSLLIFPTKVTFHLMQVYYRQKST